MQNRCDSHAFRQQGVVAACLFIVTCIGCGSSSTVPVWGQVTFDGKPIEQGEIVFSPMEGTSGPATGGSITNGEYHVPGDKGLAPGGKYRVEISGYANTGRKIEAAPGHFVDALDNFIPESFNSESTLQVTISSDSSDNRKDFALTPSNARK